ncbi:amino acid ABC transporter permease [Nocardioides sp. AX2bis]|uniref:amino acid ABC transporter permease n=1 Tax=Nocardioides sp. AX2bis TaxID=2653157 RepID=UPI0012F3FE5A|nr:amino acid ABC transporter permease [Nocardioides sp. AX2bis]VXB65956.1 Glutamate transport system permease protein [Nocardioides sp. AX2bis]
MSNVLFDTPGPRTVARHRLYTVATVLALLVLAGAVLWVLWTNGELDYDPWEFVVTPAFLQVLGQGTWTTLTQAVAAIALALVFGVVFGVGKLSDHAWLRWPCWAVVEFFRAVPLLLLIVFIFFAYGVGDGIGPYWSLVIGLMLYNGAVVAEILRAGVLAVPKGQGEAAYAIGMRKTQVMSIVLLPQAVKIMLPALISQLVVALKDTSLGFYIAAPGLTYVGRSIWTELGNQFQVAVVVATIYIVLNLLLSGLATIVQRRLVGETSPIDLTDVGNMQGGQSTGGGI